MPADPAETAAATVGDDPPRGLVITALVVGLVAVVGLLTIAVIRQRPPGPVVIAPAPAPQADGPECRGLLATLPDRLGDFRRADTAVPTPAGTAAWRTDGQPVILRCGVDRPAEFVVGSPIQMVDGVQWFRLADQNTQASTWLCVDRPAYVALTLPSGSGPTPIQAVSGAIDRSMPAVAIRPGQAR